MARHVRETTPVAPREIAPGVDCLEVGKGFLKSNVYLVRSGSSWALIDAGSTNCSRSIQEAAASLFGEDTCPASILLTHNHPDHAGSARELAKMWDCPVWVHPNELPLVFGNIATFKIYANPLDRAVILPLLRLMGRKRSESMLSQASFKEVACPLDLGAGIPGLPDWQLVPTPGHTPGHVAFFRAADRVLISGDALVTVDLNSLWGSLLKKQRVSGPPWYTTWSWRTAKESVATLAKLAPRVLAGGHGIPMTGPKTTGSVRVFSDRFRE